MVKIRDGVNKQIGGSSEQGRGKVKFGWKTLLRVKELTFRNSVGGQCPARVDFESSRSEK